MSSLAQVGRDARVRVNAMSWCDIPSGIVLPEAAGSCSFLRMEVLLSPPESSWCTHPCPLSSEHFLPPGWVLSHLTGPSRDRRTPGSAQSGFGGEDPWRAGQPHYTLLYLSLENLRPAQPREPNPGHATLLLLFLLVFTFVLMPMV